MNSTLIFPGGITLMSIRYKYNSRKFLGFIATEGAGSTEPGDPYLSSFPDIYSNVSVLLVGFIHFLSRNFNACNAIENQNMMRQSDPVLEKYWVTQSGYFRLVTIVELGMGVTDGKLLLCFGFSETRVDNNISMREYKNRAVYYCFINTLPAHCGSPDLNLPPKTIDDIPCSYKRARYTPDLLTVTISVASENYVSTLTTPSDLPRVLLLPSDDPNPPPPPP